MESIKKKVPEVQVCFLTRAGDLWEPGTATGKTAQTLKGGWALEEFHNSARFFNVWKKRETVWQWKGREIGKDYVGNYD